jgi:superfamily II DNA or RNA helicase
MRKNFEAKRDHERDVLLVLSLAGPRNISQLLELLRHAGLRETAARAYSAATLRRVLAPMVTKGLVILSESAYDAARVARELCLRDAARRGVLDRIANAIRVAAHPYLQYHSVDNSAAWFDFRVALQRHDLHKATDLLTQCSELQGDRFERDNPLVQAVCEPFDPDWAAGFGAHRGALLAWALDYANRFALPTGELVPWLYQHMREIEREAPAIRDLLAEAALLRGDLAYLQAEADAPMQVASADRGMWRATLELLHGNVDRALALFAEQSSFVQGHTGKRKTEVPLPRFHAVFQALALLGRGTPEEASRVAQLAAGRQRDKNYEFRGSAQLLKQLAEAMLAPGKAELVRHVMEPVNRTDCLALLLRGFYAAWLPVPDLEREWLLPHLALTYAELAEANYVWLAQEYSSVWHTLCEALKESPSARSGVKERRRLSVPPRPKESATRPLVGLHAAKPTWELALQALDRLTSSARTELAPDTAAAQERLAWRVYPHNQGIEPVLQKRGAGRWTSGRKVAVKQLLAGGAQHALLTAHDKRIAAHIHEEISSGWGGHIERDYYLRPRALRELVGHPLVFVEPDFETPAEIVRGEARLRAESIGDRLTLTLEPPGIGDEPRLVPEAQRWVVYCLDEAQSAIAKVIGQQLVVPAAGKSQTLEILARLAKHFTVQSSEQVDAREVDADAAPWLRLVPSGAGLNATAAVRPLGENGPVLPIAQGAPQLIASINGVALRTQRDLAQEAAQLEDLMRECPALEQSETDPGHFALTDPEQCLELLSQLRRVAVHIEWPYGKSFNLRGAVGRAALRGSLRHEGGWFLASGTLNIDAELSLDLQQLLALFADGSQRFVKLESGEYLEIERELREVLDALSLTAQKQGKTQQLAVPLNALASLETLTSEQSGFVLDKTAVEWRQRFDAAFSRPVAVPRGLNAELRDYQVEGFHWLARLAELELGACLADDMGLGKTVEIIALLLHRARQTQSSGPALVVAPTSVCTNWQREIERFAPSLRVRDYSGPRRTEALEDLRKRDVVVTSYALLQQDSESLQALEWSAVVLDEGQFIKNAETQRAQAAYGLRAPVRIVATGTPIENHPSDLWSLLHFLNPQLLGSAQQFQRRFGRVAEADDKAAARQRKDLRRMVKPFILRRTKAQVLEDLPPLTEIRHTVELSAAEAKLYETLRERALAKLQLTNKNPQNRVQILAELTRLRRLCCHPVLVAPEANLSSSKLAAFVELVEELLESRHRALVFSQFVDFLSLARSALDERAIRYQYLDGSTPQKQRMASVDAFQAGEGDLFLISLKAGGFGLNLTGADYVIHLDPWWNPAAEQQASDRAHRIGQQQPVTVYRLVTAGTIEERIVELHHRKRELANSLLEGAEGAASISQDELLGLLTQ